MQVAKLESLELDSEVQNILQKLERLEYASAVQGIEAYLAKYRGVVAYTDPEVKGLKLELKMLEQKLQDLDALKAEQLNTIEEFNTQYSLSVGDIVEKILKRKEELLAQSVAKMQEMYEAEKARYEEAKRKAKTLEEELENLTPFDDDYDALYQAWQEAKEAEETQGKKVHEAQEELEEDEAFQAYEELKEEYEEFHREYEEVLNQERYELNDEEKKELKKLFRKAARFCHPDIVTKELHDQAHEITAQLNEAYAVKDLARVKKILEMLENGVYFDIASDKLENTDKLKHKITQLREKVDAITQELEAIKADETFNTIQAIEDWDAYFVQMRDALEQEYQELLENEKPREEQAEVDV
jgi:DNA repair exonuclease SbcCD ATPase subunit